MELYLLFKFEVTCFIFTARIQRMGEGTVFSLFVSLHLDGGGGYPISGLDRGYPIPAPGRGVPHPADRGYPRSRWGVTPSQVWMRGYPIPGPGRGYPIQLMGVFHPRSGLGGYPIPGPPQPGLDGVPHPPGQDW